VRWHPARRPVAAAAAVLAAATLAACTGTPAGTPAAGPALSTATSAAPSTGVIAIDPADRAACASLFARLQRVTAAIDGSSELIAQSVSAQDLSQRIAVEQVQLERSAQLMTQEPVPAPLADADRRLVAALRGFAADFGRARVPAARGDFQAAAQAMTDPPLVQRILDAAKTIEDACRR
jgi:TolA-binding protein